MPEFVEVAVNVPRVSGVFHYHLPKELEGQIKVGHLVTAPFGKQRVQGVVLGFVASPEVPETKPIDGLLDDQITLTPQQIAFANELSSTALAPLAVCIALMLPPGLSQLADTLFTLSMPEGAEEELNQLQTRLAAVLEKRGPLRGRQIDRALPRRAWRPAARELVKRGWMESQPALPPPRVRPKYVRTAQLGVPPEIVLADIQGLGRAKAGERRYKILNFLLREPDPVDVAWVYAESGGNLRDLQRLNELGLVILREEEAWRDPLAGLSYDLSYPPPLTKDQETAWGEIQAGMETAHGGKLVKPFLLHGVTGSGKTEIYLRAVAETIKNSQQALVLVPEISLTPQTVRRFIARFPGRVGLLHSRLSDGERYDTWRRARQGRLDIIIGPRSSLFAPLPDIGLIVVDESHADSYYQSSNPPFFHARQAAAAYAKLCGAVCIMGTATPDVTSFYAAQQGKWQLLELPARILAHQETVQAYAERFGEVSNYKPAGGQAEGTALPQVEVVDMRSELKTGNTSIFSEELQAGLAQVLEREQQAILFLNRRGTATYVFCRDCGHVLRCPRCDTSFTFHADSKKELRCHHCGYHRQSPENCPNCGSHRIRHYGTGTQKVEAEVLSLFPEARTLRWDHETTRQKGAHEMILNHFSNQRADILVGTQMLAKGLDLPMVTLVGVVLADVGLHLPDYRAGERVFQVLTQVAGRAGRSPLLGRVILQTFHPENYVIQAAAEHDYAGFAAQELAYRKKLGYPPYARLVRLLYRHPNAAAAEKEALAMAARLKTWIKQEDRRATELIGPAPGYYARLDGKYRWQIVLRGPDPASMLVGKKMGDWKIESNPQALL